MVEIRNLHPDLEKCAMLFMPWIVHESVHVKLHTLATFCLCVCVRVCVCVFVVFFLFCFFFFFFWGGGGG